MGKLDGLRLGFGICASFCNFENTINVLKRLKTENDITIIPIMTDNAYNNDTRFGMASDIIEEIENITENKILKNLVEVEPLGPKNIIDLMLVCPCTGNTLAKLANGITDNSVLGAVKTLRRNNKPVVIAVSSNDLTSINLKNVGNLINIKDIYFVPFYMDNPDKKPNSMICDFDLVEATIEKGLLKEQIQPVIKSL